MFLCSSFWSQNNHSFPGSCRAAATASHILRERTHFNVSSNARATLFFFFTHFLHSLARNSRSLHLTELILIRGCPVSYSATAPLISVEFCWFTHKQSDSLFCKLLLLFSEFDRWKNDTFTWKKDQNQNKSNPKNPEKNVNPEQCSMLSTGNFLLSKYCQVFYQQKEEKHRPGSNILFLNYFFNFNTIWQPPPPTPTRKKNTTR